VPATRSIFSLNKPPPPPPTDLLYPIMAVVCGRCAGRGAPVARPARTLFRDEKEHRFWRKLCDFPYFLTRAFRRTQRWHARGLRFRPSPNQAKSRANAATQQLEDSGSLSKGSGRFKLASAGWNQQTRRFSCDSRCIDSEAPAVTQRREAADWR